MMHYEQFLYEVAMDFKSLYSDFEHQLLEYNDITSFDDYFQDTTMNENIMDEIYREAAHFGLTREKFLHDLYSAVKNFDGQIEKKISQIEMRLKNGQYAKKNQFHVKKTISILQQSLSNQS